MVSAMVQVELARVSNLDPGLRHPAFPVDETVRERTWPRGGGTSSIQNLENTAEPGRNQSPCGSPHTHAGVPGRQETSRAARHLLDGEPQYVRHPGIRDR